MVVDSLQKSTPSELPLPAGPPLNIPQPPKSPAGDQVFKHESAEDTSHQTITVTLLSLFSIQKCKEENPTETSNNSWLAT